MQWGCRICQQLAPSSVEQSRPVLDPGRPFEVGFQMGELECRMPSSRTALALPGDPPSPHSSPAIRRPAAFGSPQASFWVVGMMVWEAICGGLLGWKHMKSSPLLQLTSWKTRRRGACGQMPAMETSLYGAVKIREAKHE